jgi:hypothetical protein
LIETVGAHRQRVHTLRYEDLVADPHGTLQPLFGHLGLDYDPAAVERFGDVRLEGRVQDPNVSKEAFRLVRPDRVDQWRTILANPARKAWCRRYLRWLGDERMAAMGYDLDATLADLDALWSSRRFLGSDLVLMPYDVCYRTMELGLFAKKLRDARAGRPTLAHK